MRRVTNWTGISNSLIFKPLLFCPFIVSLFLFSCGASQALNREQTPEGEHFNGTRITFQQQPSYLNLLAAEDRLFLFAETVENDLRYGHVIPLSPDGRPVGPQVNIANGYQDYFGDAQISPRGGMNLGLVRHRDEISTTLDLLHMDNNGRVAHRFRCLLPYAAHGQFFEFGDDYFVLFEGLDGSLSGFYTPISAPVCAAQNEIISLLPAPLPDEYLMTWVDDEMVLAGKSGDSFRAIFFDRSLRFRRDERFAASQATNTEDLSFYSSDTLGRFALYSAQQNGSWSIYMASLDQLRAGVLAATRVVTSADRERRPRAYETEEGVIVSWRSTDGLSQEQIYLAAMLPSLERGISGGEVLYRHTPSNNLGAGAWTDSGWIRAWYEDGYLEGEGAVYISSYKPSFWPVPASP